MARPANVDLAAEPDLDDRGGEPSPLDRHATEENVEVRRAATLELDHGHVLDPTVPPDKSLMESLPATGQELKARSGVLVAGHRDRGELSRPKLEPRGDPASYPGDEAGTAGHAVPATAAEWIDAGRTAVDADEREAPTAHGRLTDSVPNFYVRRRLALRFKDRRPIRDGVARARARDRSLTQWRDGHETATFRR
jgi:hypothetical protein